jgi:AraC-like DNA-binding protein
MEISRTPVNKNFVWNSDANDSSFSVTFPKSPDMDLILIGAELHQNMEEHDRLVLHFKGHPNLKREAIASGDPLQFIFRSGKVSSTWLGYIHHIKQNNTHQGGNTDIICVGASWVLKDTDQKIYKNLTADQVVARIAQKHGMQAITQRHPRLKETIVQAGQSDWQLCRRLAKVTGFALRCENTSILFVSKDKVSQTKRTSAPYFNYVDSQYDGTVPRELRMTGTILNFTPMISDQAPELGVRVDRVISGANPVTGTIVKSTHPAKAIKTKNLGKVLPNDKYFAS